MWKPWSKKARWSLIFLALAMIVGAFFVASDMGKSPPPIPSASEEQLKQQLAGMREAFEELSKETLKLRKEISADVARIRREEYARHKVLPADDVAAGLAALLDESRREHAGDEF